MTHVSDSNNQQQQNKIKTEETIVPNFKTTNSFLSTKCKQCGKSFRKRKLIFWGFFRRLLKVFFLTSESVFCIFQNFFSESEFLYFQEIPFLSDYLFLYFCVFFRILKVFF